MHKCIGNLVLPRDTYKGFFVYLSTPSGLTSLTESVTKMMVN